MRKRSGLFINNIQILAVLCFLITFFDLTYINYIFKYTKIIRAIISLVILILCSGRIKRLIKLKPKTLYLLLIVSLYIIVNSLIKGRSITLLFGNLIPCFLLCITIYITANQKEIIEILKIWCCLFFVLLIIDLYTMVRFPKGLYSTETYTTNWFLGYETYRLSFTFPLIVFYYYLCLFSKGKMGILYVITLLVAVDAYLSGGTAAFLIVIIYMVLVFLTMQKQYHKKDNFWGKILNIALNYRVFLIFYTFLILTIVINQNSFKLYDFLLAYFGKSATNGGRTRIWAGTMQILQDNWFFGAGMLTGAEYKSYIIRYNNAHNVILTYLVTGGIIGLIILLLYFVELFRFIEKNQQYLFIELFFYCFFILGIASSALAFSPYVFAISILPLMDYKKPYKIKMKNQRYTITIRNKNYESSVRN